jgi:hypothetical protein
MWTGTVDQAPVVDHAGGLHKSAIWTLRGHPNAEYRPDTERARCEERLRSGHSSHRSSFRRRKPRASLTPDREAVHRTRANSGPQQPLPANRLLRLAVSRHRIADNPVCRDRPHHRSRSANASRWGIGTTVEAPKLPQTVHHPRPMQRVRNGPQQVRHP